MKSIQSKIILLILIGIIVSTATIGGIGIISFERVIDDESVKLMNYMCGEEAQSLNNILGKIEQSVKIMSVYANDNFIGRDELAVAINRVKDYTRELDELGITVASETEGAVAIYFRLCPEITSTNEGFFRVKNMDTGEFESVELTDLTDLSKYDANDIEQIGWYLLPINAGRAVWTAPYYNKRVDIYMISYVIPIYHDGELFGIMGMDIDFNYIMEQCDRISIYETGSAFLTDADFRIIHSKNLESGILISELSKSLADACETELIVMDTLYEYTLNGTKMKVVFRPLENGMCLAVTAPVEEIDRTKNRLVTHMVAFAVLIIIIFIFIARATAKTIVKPLKDLNIAAKEIASGNLDVSLPCKSKDEVGTLSESLQETASQLKRRIDYINNLAYVDKLTNVKNNTAYLREISLTEERMQKDGSGFTVFVIDVNGLKNINDTYGHDYGNKLLIVAAKAIVDIFGYENVYRIGGDEFAVLMKSHNAEKNRILEQQFEERLKKPFGDIKLSAAIGSAVYNQTSDIDYEDVFKRADGKMYQMKLKMKQSGENSTVNKLY